MVNYNYSLPYTNMVPNDVMGRACEDVNYKTAVRTSDDIITVDGLVYKVTEFPDTLIRQNNPNMILVSKFMNTTLDAAGCHEIEHAVAAGIQVGVMGVFGSDLMQRLAEIGVKFFILGYETDGIVSDELADQLYDCRIQDILYQRTHGYGCGYSNVPVYVTRVKNELDMIATYMAGAAGALVRRGSPEQYLIETRRECIAKFMGNLKCHR